MGCTLCTMTVGEPVAGVPTAASSERQLELERSEARVQRGVTSVTEGVVELMLRGRRQGIFNDDSDDGAAAVDTDDVDVDVPVTLSMEDTLLIVESLRANELFSCLEPSQLNILAKRMTLRRVQGGEFVYSQGDLGDTFYIIKSGHFDVTTNDDRLRALVVGNSFGELGLLYKCIRSDTVGLSDEGGNVGELFCLKACHGRTFRDIVAKMSTGSINISKDALRRVSLLESLTESQLDTVAEAVRALHFREGDIIVRKGEQGNVLYMIQAGTVVCTDIGALNDIELGDGDYFGERALIKDEPRAATVYAKTDVHVMALDRGVFTTVLGPLHEIIKHNLMMRSVQSIPLLKDLSDVQKQQLIERTPLVPFAPNQAILTEGEVGNDFYIVVSGKVHVTQAAGDRVVHLNTLSCGDYFGEKAALQHVPARRNATVTAATAVECLVVDPTLFQSIREPIQTALESNMDARNQMSQDKIFAASITVASLERIKVLGIGSFGLVYIARHTPSGRFVAVKEMYKARLESSKQMGHVLAEKELLSTFHHPFVLKFLVALQEERKVYIVTESLMGGELFQRIVNAAGVPTPLPMPHARFYAGCVVKALKYLHTRNVAYRDLKPENILLDNHGYAKVVDFGFAKKVTKKTYTLCGTPEYLAPEIVMGIGHGCMVDNWALGILIFEMVMGDSPFADAKDDHMTICRSILRGRIEFKKDADPEWRRLVEGLLTREPTKRMSCLSGAVESHPWFAGFAWDDLLALKMPAPWTPNIVAGDDVRWFSPVDAEELKDLKEWDFVRPEKDWSAF